MGFLEDHKTLVIATVAATGGALALWTISAHRRRNGNTSLTTTDFDSFLRRPIDNPSLQHHQQQNKQKKNYTATSFEAYLKHTESSSSQLFEESSNTGDTATSPDTLVNAAAPCCPPDAKPVTILYGTEFGFSREIAEKLCQRIENYSNNNDKIKTYWPELLNLADFPDGIFCLDRCQVVLIACSTQGDGVPPTEVRDFCSWLFGPTAPKLSSTLSSSAPSATTPPPTAESAAGVKFSVLALGDRSYTHFARCGKSIDARLEELGGQRFLPRVDVNKEDMPVVDAWIENVVSKLDSLNLSTAESLGWNGVLSSISSSSSIENTNNNTSNGVSSNNTNSTAITKLSKSKPYFAVVTKVDSLCNKTTVPQLSSPSPTNTTITTSTIPTTIQEINNNKNNDNKSKVSKNIDEKNTVHIEIDLGSSGIEYLPGDALGIWPTNDPRDVDDLLEAAGFAQYSLQTNIDGNDQTNVVGNEEEVLVKVPSWHYKDEVISNDNGGLISLREALTRCYDLKCPKPELLHLLAKKLADLKGEEENGNTLFDRLSSVLLTSNKNVLEKYLSERHIADILRDWNPGTGPLLTKEELLSMLRQLQPRLYSISSSPLGDSLLEEEEDGCVLSSSSSSSTENIEEKVVKLNGVSNGVNGDANGAILQNHPHPRHPHTVQLTVAVLKYTSAVGKPRVGVASTYLAERSQLLQNQSTIQQPQQGGGTMSTGTGKSENARVPVYLYKNPDFRLPTDLKTPIIMVGPGTGVAPFRGFIQHRILLAKKAAAMEKNESERKKAYGESNSNGDGRKEEEKLKSSILGPALLFFGCRRRDQDYLYGTELEKWDKQGFVRLFTAFSRETNKKIYVQHRLVENGELVWQLLEAGAVFYVCGDGAHMAGDVETALKSIIEQYQGQGDAAAVQYFENMVRNGRYKKDVWTS